MSNVGSSKKLFERLQNVFKKSLDEIAYRENRKINHEEKLKRLNFHSLESNEQAKNYRTSINPLDTTFGSDIKDFYEYRRAGTEKTKQREYLIGGKRIIFDKDKTYKDFLEEQKEKDKPKQKTDVDKYILDLEKGKEDKMTKEEKRKREEENQKGLKMYNIFKGTNPEYYNITLYTFLDVISKYKTYVNKKEYYNLIPIFEFVIKLFLLFLKVITFRGNSNEFLTKNFEEKDIITTSTSPKPTSYYRLRSDKVKIELYDRRVYKLTQLHSFIKENMDKEQFTYYREHSIYDHMVQFSYMGNFGDGKPLDIIMIYYVLYQVFPELLKRGLIRKDYMDDELLEEFKDFYRQDSIERELIERSMEYQKETTDVKGKPSNLFMEKSLYGLLEIGKEKISDTYSDGLELTPKEFKEYFDYLKYVIEEFLQNFNDLVDNELNKRQLFTEYRLLKEELIENIKKKTKEKGEEYYNNRVEDNVNYPNLNPRYNIYEEMLKEIVESESSKKKIIRIENDVYEDFIGVLTYNNILPSFSATK